MFEAAKTKKKQEKEHPQQENENKQAICTQFNSITLVTPVCWCNTYQPLHVSTVSHDKFYEHGTGKTHKKRRVGNRKKKHHVE